MSVLGEGAFAVLPKATGFPPNDNRITLDVGEIPFVQPGTYLLDVALERVQSNQTYSQGFRIIVK